MWPFSTIKALREHIRDLGEDLSKARAKIKERDERVGVLAGDVSRLSDQAAAEGRRADQLRRELDDARREADDAKANLAGHLATFKRVKASLVGWVDCAKGGDSWSGRVLKDANLDGSVDKGDYTLVMQPLGGRRKRTVADAKQWIRHVVETGFCISSDIPCYVERRAKPGAPVQVTEEDL